jgi:hypothetical protein
MIFKIEFAIEIDSQVFNCWHRRMCGNSFNRDAKVRVIRAMIVVIYEN